MRPVLEFLSTTLVERIVAEALSVLSRTGVFVEHAEALSLLADHGARVGAGGRAYLPDELVWRCVRSAPHCIEVYDREGHPALRLTGLEVHFDPGSAALKILDRDSGEARAPVTADLVDFARVTDALPQFAAQSTGIVPSDVPPGIADRYRLYLALLHSRKPIVTGTFTIEGFAVMKDMLAAAAGSEERLRQRPSAIFDACASQPLKWSALTTSTLLDCARSGIPAELISVPLLGATAPVTLAGALVQHTAENLGGLVIHQLAAPGAPVVYGGSAAALDMRHGTIAMGAAETMMLAAGYAQIGRYLGLPTHGYAGLSDAKVIDAQAGLETGMGAAVAALAGINVVSGAGMLEFENCQSLEKLVLDNEICGMAKRLVAGVEPRTDPLAEDLFSGGLSDGEHFLTSASTVRWLREEVIFPGPVIDRQSREVWERAGRNDATSNARRLVADILGKQATAPLDDRVRQDLAAIMLADARGHGLDRLPGHQ